MGVIFLRGIEISWNWVDAPAGEVAKVMFVCFLNGSCTEKSVAEEICE